MPPIPPIPMPPACAPTHKATHQSITQSHNTQCNGAVENIGHDTQDTKNTKSTTLKPHISQSHNTQPQMQAKRTQAMQWCSREHRASDTQARRRATHANSRNIQSNQTIAQSHWGIQARTRRNGPLEYTGHDIRKAQKRSKRTTSQPPTQTITSTTVSSKLTHSSHAGHSSHASHTCKNTTQAKTNTNKHKQAHNHHHNDHSSGTSKKQVAETARMVLFLPGNPPPPGKPPPPPPPKPPPRDCCLSSRFAWRSFFFCKTCQRQQLVQIQQTDAKHRGPSR